MTVLVDEVIGYRDGSVFGRLERDASPRVRPGVRREQALRRPPRGAGRTSERLVRPIVRGVRACMVERRMSGGSLVLIALAVSAVIAFSGTVIASMVDSMAPAVPSKTAVVSVPSGQSLWSVAQRYAPGSDTGAVVDRIVDLNDLHGGVVPVGSSLVVPVSG